MRIQRHHTGRRVGNTGRAQAEKVSGWLSKCGRWSGLINRISRRLSYERHTGRNSAGYLSKLLRVEFDRTLRVGRSIWCSL